jgi:hypothetical protein
MFAHYTAHARGDLCPLWVDDAARWLWRHLRRAFPDALAALLMPDHPHLVGPAGRDAAFRRVLVGFSRHLGYGELWKPIPPAEVLSTPDKVQRVVRYALLNPCRPTRLRGEFVQLAPEPLAWTWSTHRDVVGCSADPWVTAERLHPALGWTRRDFRARFHKYVSADPHVCIEGTPLPRLVAARRMPEGSLELVRRAVLAATRAPASALREKTPARRLFLRLAYRQGWRCPTELGRSCSLHANSVTRIIRAAPNDDPALLACLLCLDPRLVENVRLPNVEGLWL